MATPSAAAQAAKIATLEVRVRELETALGLHDDALGAALRLPQSLSKLLGLLLAVPNVTPDMIQERLSISTDAKVAIHRLRTYLMEWRATIGEDPIQSKRSLGYWIDRDIKLKIRDLVTSRVTGPTERPRVVPQHDRIAA